MYYKIANLIVRMDSFGRTAQQAKPYICEPSEADIVIESQWQMLRMRQPHLSEEDCEYLSTGGSFCSQLLNYNGMVLHASAVVRDGRAYLFSAPCGTGKSTHTALWLKTFGDCFILNDDKPALRYEEGIWYAYGTPWSGKYDISRNARVPVFGICFLHQAAENSIVPFKGEKAVFALFEQTARPSSGSLRARLLELTDLLFTHVPVWRMNCNMDPEAAVLAHAAMSGAAKEIML